MFLLRKLFCSCMNYLLLRGWWGRRIRYWKLVEVGLEKCVRSWHLNWRQRWRLCSEKIQLWLAAEGLSRWLEVSQDRGRCGAERCREFWFLILKVMRVDISKRCIMRLSHHVFREGKKRFSCRRSSNGPYNWFLSPICSGKEAVLLFLLLR